MDKVSIIIPARGEKEENLLKTLDSINENAIGDYEIIVGINGSPDMFGGRNTWLNNGKGLKRIFFPENIGIKGNLNALAATASGKYLLKLDAHCAVGKGFDEILKADMQDDWVATPRFTILKDDWTIQTRDGQEEFYDYFYLCCPFTDPKGLRFKAGGHWRELTQKKDPNQKWMMDGKILDLKSPVWVDSTPQIHGSCWFMTKDRFFELGGFPLQDPYGHGQEPLWIALKNWVEGGLVVVNKKTWYAHLHQNSKDRGYPENKEETERTYRLTADYWLKHPKFETFIDRFMPMPGWPSDWRELLHKYQNEHS